MIQSEILFFASPEDITPILISVESTFKVKYYQTGLFDEKSEALFTETVANAPGFGTVSGGNWMDSLSFLVMRKDLELNIRTVPQRKGGVKYAIDQQVNKESCVFRPGGVYGEDVLLAGLINTAYISDFANNILNEFSGFFKKYYTKIDGFYVGDIARKKMNAGYRLVTDIRSPIQYDLKEKK